jgi:hypothetical protein
MIVGLNDRWEKLLAAAVLLLSIMTRYNSLAPRIPTLSGFPARQGLQVRIL